MKVLHIVSCAYRATTEEQDDTVIWLTLALRNAGADIDVLLRGNAVNYAVEQQDASGLSFGEWRQKRPPRIKDDITSLVNNGATVYLLHEDLADRGLQDGQLVSGPQRIRQRDIAELIDQYDGVWQW